jgi:hypothetical protein
MLAGTWNLAGDEPPDCGSVNSLQWLTKVAESREK